MIHSTRKRKTVERERCSTAAQARNHDLLTAAALSANPLHPDSHLSDPDSHALLAGSYLAFRSGPGSDQEKRVVPLSTSQYL